jgi:hypothetical protein
MISVRSNNSQGEKEGTTTDKEPTTIEISLAMKRHWESEIKILRDAPRDAEKRIEILKEKQEEYEKAKDSEDIERLIPEIEMLKFVLFLVCRNERARVEVLP